MMAQIYGPICRKMSTSTALKSESAPLYNVPPWNDVTSVLISTTAQGSNAPTVSRFAQNGTSQGVFTYLFNSDNVERELYAVVQLPHSYKPGSTINPHIHFTVSAANTGTTQWGLEYTASAENNNFSATTTIINGTLTIAAASTNKHMILSFPTITDATFGPSTILMCRIFRYNNTVDTLATGVYLLQFDFHIQNDTAGTRTEFVK